MKLTPFVILLFLLQTSIACALDFDKHLKFFNKKCDSENKGGQLILIDNTQPLSKSQKQFVKDNFIKNLLWDNIGDRITIASLYNEPVALMQMYSICAPKHKSQITMFDPGAKIRGLNKMFINTLLEAFKRITDKSEVANSTLLMEAITEVYRSARYNFKDKGKRQLTLVSDLYQHSQYMNFYNECQKPVHNKPRTCPSVNEMITANEPFKNYLEVAKPKLNNKDHIKIFYLNVSNRVDRSAEGWWKEYFKLSGLNSAQIEIIPELQN